jgi:hypothetical protein
MPTPKECRHNAEICIKLADETREIYAKKALIELAEEFRVKALGARQQKRSLYDAPLISGRKNPIDGHHSES